MKNKALTYVLLVVVAIIWYRVFMRVKSNIMTDDENPTLAIQQQVGFQLMKKDTFLLDANYRDPFIGKKNKAETGNMLLQPEPIPVPKPAKPQFVWPQINYYGWVKKTDSKNPLCIINIDGMLLYLRKGDEVFDDISVQQVDRDFIRLKKGKNQQNFFRE